MPGNTSLNVSSICLGMSSQCWVAAEKALSGTNLGYLQSVSVLQQLYIFLNWCPLPSIQVFGFLFSVFLK